MSQFLYSIHENPHKLYRSWPAVAKAVVAWAEMVKSKSRPLWIDYQAERVIDKWNGDYIGLHIIKHDMISQGVEMKLRKLLETWEDKKDGGDAGYDCAIDNCISDLEDVILDIEGNKNEI